jgi:hypothetical protein
MEANIDSLPSAAKYKAMYEESINPFTVFTQKQKALRKDAMVSFPPPVFLFL